MFTEYDNRVKTELESAKAEYKDAYERGDTDSIVNANEKLSRLSVESESLRRVSAKRKQADEDGVEIPVTDTVIPASPNPQPAQPDPMAQQWAEKNQWFGKDQGLTFAAFGIHRELMDEGYDGTTNDYYKELDNRLSNFGNRNYTDNEQVLDSPDIVIIATNHSEFKNIAPMINKCNPQLIYDVWSIFKENDFPNIKYIRFGKGL